MKSPQRRGEREGVEKPIPNRFGLEMNSEEAYRFRLPSMAELTLLLQMALCGTHLTMHAWMDTVLGTSHSVEAGSEWDGASMPSSSVWTFVVVSMLTECILSA